MVIVTEGVSLYLVLFLPLYIPSCQTSRMDLLLFLLSRKSHSDVCTYFASNSERKVLPQSGFGAWSS